VRTSGGTSGLAEGARLVQLEFRGIDTPIRGPIQCEVPLTWSLSARWRQRRGLPNNKELEVQAGVIRLRAERRLDQMIAAQKKTTGLNRGGCPTKTPSASEGVSTLDELFISGKLSTHAQKLAAVNDASFETPIKVFEEKVRGDSEWVSEKRAQKVTRVRDGGAVDDLVALVNGASGSRLSLRTLPHQILRLQLSFA
jgi:hypothetical protein